MVAKRNFQLLTAGLGLLKKARFLQQSSVVDVSAKPACGWKPVKRGKIKNRKKIEIDFLLASRKENRIHAYEIKRGRVNRKTELNRLISKTARLTFKSIHLRNPRITGDILSLRTCKLPFLALVLFMGHRA